MKHIKSFGSVYLTLLLVIYLTACSNVKSYFPDKQKDYRYSAEISALNLPADLSDNSIEEEVSIDPNALAREQDTSGQREAQRLKSRIGERRGRVELVSYQGGATRLVILEPFSRSWFIVGKALSRSKMEVISRNQVDGAYALRYDPRQKEIEDGSLINEIEYFFGEDLHQDEEFNIRLAENGLNNTEVIVLDKDNVPLSKGVGLSLMMLLFDYIKTDISQ
jgi:outer membrane protein assembly factor BamC